MRNTNSKVRCEKRQLGKCKEVVKTYNEVQYESSKPTRMGTENE